MRKTFQGSCHCKAVRFEADLDLATQTSRCNCSVCSKLRLWKVSVPPAAMRLSQGEDMLSEYRFGSRKVLHQFCRTCGTKLFGRGETGGQPFVVISVAALDGATDEELAGAHITFQDGRHDAFDREPSETGYL